LKTLPVGLCARQLRLDLREVDVEPAVALDQRHRVQLAVRVGGDVVGHAGPHRLEQHHALAGEQVEDEFEALLGAAGAHHMLRAQTAGQPARTQP
jgi:hypothetical protein